MATTNSATHRARSYSPDNWLMVTCALTHRTREGRTMSDIEPGSDQWLAQIKEEIIDPDRAKAS